jgi:hypothetical protein
MQTGSMFRTLLLAFILAVPIGLVWLFGFWVLVAFSVLAVATLLFSAGRAIGVEEDQGGRLTGYGTTSYADF